MVALPSNTTDRVFFDYVTGTAASSREHTIGLRSDTGVTLVETDYQIKMLNILQAIGAGNLRIGWRIVRVRVQAKNTNFSLPVGILPSLAAFVGTSNATWPIRSEAQEWTFQGRSGSTGRRVDLSIYGISTTPPDTFRYTTAVGWVADVLTQLNTQTPLALRTVDGSVATWYPYVNFNYNSYWEAELRF